MLVSTHRNNDLYSAATSLGIIAVNTSYESLADLLVECIDGLTLEQAYGLLDNPAPAAEWRATLAAAMASDLESLDGQVEALAAATHGELVSIKGQLAAVSDKEGRAREIESAKQALREREQAIREALFEKFGNQANEFWVSWAVSGERERIRQLEAEDA